MRDIKVVILAGGKGTRLGRQSEKIPKPMVIIGDRPLLEHQILLCRRYGLNDIIIITGHLSDYIERYFGDGSDRGVRITYFRETQPLGTTGGIKELEADLQDDFIVLYGDVMLDINLLSLVDFHQKKRSDCTLVVHPNDHPFDSDLVEIDARQKIIAFHAKPHPPELLYRNLVNAAAYVLSPRIFPFITKGVKADFGKDIFPRILTELNLFGYITAEYIKDAGTPERLAQVTHDHQNGRIRHFNNENRRKAVFIDRDGVINREVGLLHTIRDFELLPGTCQAIRSLNASDYLAVVITNQPVVARNLCSVSQLEAIHKKMEMLLGEQHAKLDAIYYCPHHPDRGYPGENEAYKIDCTCRKPKPGMVMQAAADFNIDLTASFFIGDSARDIQCGKNAGTRTVGVRTGYGCIDATIEPDYFFDDLQESVHFITHEPYRDVCALICEALPHPTVKHEKFIITIGGNSRSGKSTCAQYLADTLEKKGCHVLLIKLDNWLVPLEQRQEKHNSVHARFQLPTIEADIESLMHGKTIRRMQYDSRSRSYTDNPVCYTAAQADIVIIEGIVALGSNKLRSLSNLKLFCTISEQNLYARMKTFYSWKGLDCKAIDKIFKTRQSDEYNIIEQDRQHADIVLDEAGKIRI